MGAGKNGDKNSVQKDRLPGGWYHHTLLITALKRQSQADFCEFKARVSTKSIPGQPRLCRESLSQKTKCTNKEKKNKNKQNGVFPNTIIKLCSLIFFYVLSSCPINYSIIN